MRLPEPLLGARGTSPPLDDCLGGVAPGPAYTLGAVRPRVSALAADLLPLAGIADIGVRPPTVAASAGDLLLPAGGGDLLPTTDTGVLSIVAGAEASTPVHCWTGGGLPAVTTSKSSDSEKSTPADEELSSGVDSSVVGG